MKTTRTYTQTARAEAAEATYRRILDAAASLGRTRLLPDISLDDIAQEAGVSVQTVLRRFGSRAGLVRAVFEEVSSSVAEERRAEPGDVPGAVRVIVDHYEQRGDAVVMMLAQEHAEEAAAFVVGRGRAMHRAWVEEVFGALLPGGAARSATVDLLVVATDVYTWKLLRRDRGLDRATTEKRMHALVTALLT